VRIRYLCYPPPMPNLTSRARTLRRNQTSAEVKLWGALRKQTLNGHRFVRQAAIGNYIVDFLCREKMLIIEVDGATHGDADEVAYDARRTAYLEAQGFEVFRVWNADVYENLNGVLDGLLMVLEKRESRFSRRHPLRPSGTSPSGAEGG
jgi:very-short-patch-repair endonuclease